LTLDFNIDDARPRDVLFGIGLHDSTLAIVSTEIEVKQALVEMAQTTWAMLSKHSARHGPPSIYDPSETHSGDRYTVLTLDNDLAQTARWFHTAEGLPEENKLLDRLLEMDFYFGRFQDQQGRRLTAIRKAGGFKGTLNKKGLLQLFGDELRLIDEKTFQLDQYFDMLIDNAQLHILKPTQFETICKMEQAILGAVPKNLDVIVQHVPFIHRQSVEVYASKHPRAARFLASIRQNGFAEDVDQHQLMDACLAWKIETECSDDGVVIVSDRTMLKFLKMLDMRLYEGGFGIGPKGQFEATGRSRMS